MKVYIKHKITLLGGTNEIFDNNRLPVYKVEIKPFSATKIKLLYDANSNLLYTIKNKLFSFLHHIVYVLDANGKKVATIKKGKFSFNRKYQILDTVEKMHIDGKTFSYDGTIYKNDVPFAQMRSDSEIIKNAFSLEADEKDLPFCIALILASENVWE